MAGFNNLSHMVLPEMSEMSMELGDEHAAGGQAQGQPRAGELALPQQPRVTAGTVPLSLDLVSAGSAAAAVAHPGFTPVGQHTGGPVTFQGPSTGLQGQGGSLQGGAPPAHLAHALAQQAAGYDPGMHGAEEAVDIVGDGQPRVQPQPRRSAVPPRPMLPARVAEISHFIGNWDAVINIAEVRLPL